ncbi:alpha/beta hydrolase [Corynebacterium aquilae]|uniref:Alpha/beta hydrolase fold-3 domain-containing protein n=1 Tax=Corynebacterium aquilae DSM 44791 TaxID=1431546 RepID=A0A1L7CD81_9CORY|nr:alpha/beta hydrolase fold domain-containing protein [Corynebacterium aquilae]APT83798.1 hypothetical protein CAQU_00375 [Corynebacterium aquilae DSM 44791]
MTTSSSRPVSDEHQPDVVHDEATGRDFHVGGTDHALSDVEQLEQLRWYVEQHHPAPKNPTEADCVEEAQALADEFDAWAARLPDRLVHAAMMMLGAARDHSWPGSRLSPQLRVEEQDFGTVITPAQCAADAPVVVCAHGGAFVRGGGQAREMAWLPVVAALAEASGAVVVDVDYPVRIGIDIAEQVDAVGRVIEWVRETYPDRTVVGLGASAGAVLVAAHAHALDGLVLSRPTMATESKLVAAPFAIDTSEQAVSTWPATCVLVGEQDERVPRHETVEAHAHKVHVYPATHLILTPEVARARLADAAAFIRDLA